MTERESMEEKWADMEARIAALDTAVWTLLKTSPAALKALRAYCEKGPRELPEAHPNAAAMMMPDRFMAHLDRIVTQAET
jgi:hypothetical protein